MFAVRPVWWHFLWWILLAPLLLLEFRALHGVEELLALRDPARAQRTVASVTGERTSSTQTLIRYRFQIPGDPTWYSATGMMLGQRDLWTPVDPAVGRAARQSRSVEVVYLPENPWVNQPQGRAGNPVADSIAGWMLFFIVDLVWLAELFLIGRNFLRALYAAERQQQVRMRFWRTVRA